MKKSEMETRINALWNNGYAEEFKYFGNKSTKSFCRGCIIGAVIVYVVDSVIDACILKFKK